MAKKYVSMNSLIYLIQLLKTEFGNKVAYDDVVNALDSLATQKPLSAAQGKMLSDKIDTQSTTLTEKIESSSKELTEKIEGFGLTPDGKIDRAKNSDTADNALSLGGLPAAKYVHTEDDGKISSSVLPSYVDDVIEGYYHNGTFYEDEAYESQITPESGKIYVDLSNETEPVSYRYSGSVFIQIVSSDMVEITNDEINNIWSPS